MINYISTPWLLQDFADRVDVGLQGLAGAKQCDYKSLLRFALKRKS